MNNVTIYGNFNPIKGFLEGNVMVTYGYDDCLENHYRFTANTDLYINTLNISHEFFYRNLKDLILDLNYIILEISKNEEINENEKNFLIYSISLLIKDIKTNYK